MEPNQTITIDLEVWQKTQAEIQRLKQENLMLKVQVRHLTSNNSQFRNRHSLTQQGMIMISEQNKNFKDEKAELKKSMTEWMAKLNFKYFKKQQKKHQNFIPESLKKNLTEIQDQEKQKQNQEEMKKQNNQQNKLEQNIKISLGTNLQVQNQKQSQIFKKQQLLILSKKKFQQLALQKIKQMKLVQSICLFGPGQKDIKQNILSRKMSLKNSLLYINNKQEAKRFQIYGQYFYPDGLVTVRNIRQQEAVIQIQQIIFRKNAKKQDCNLFVFRGDETNQQLKLQNPIISKINPGKWLTAFFVQFSDYDILNIEQNNEIMEQKANRSTIQTNNPINQAKQIDEIKNGQQSDRVNKHKKINTYHVKGKYTLCIFTYFPIINVMELMLSSIMDEMKVRRVGKYKNKNDVTIKFFINELAQIGQLITTQIDKIPCNFGSQNLITFNNFQITIDMSESRIDQLLFSGWVHDVLKVFDKDLIYQLFTNMMTQQSVCFVSENLHLLTYVVFFFVCILTNPFSYPHPCISNVFNFQLLQSPFVVTAGINQSSKWLQQNVMNYPKKIFVDLNDESKIKGKKKPKTIKSQKLRKIFNNLYKKVQTTISPVPQIFKKKQTIIRPATRQQNDASATFIKSLQYFYTEQIFNFLPNRDIITFIRDKIQEKNQISKIYNILKQIQKYLKQSRKHKQKDQFVDLLIQQQIFYVYMGAKYDLD